jgi:polysaccharide export outer membrane protein
VTAQSTRAANNGIAQQAKGRPAPVIALPISIGDEVDINVFGANDLSTHQRVDSTGNVNLALVGLVHVAGLTSTDAEAVIEKRLRDGGFMLDPHVTIFVKEYSAAGVAILGEVQHPGIYPILGPHHLWDMILAAGGMTEKAGNRVLLRHQGSDEAALVTISNDPEQALNSNVEVRAGDSIVVSRAGLIYVIGEVQQSAGYIMDHDNSISVLEALAKAHGPTQDAALNKSRIVRKNAQGEPVEIPLHLKDMLAAKQPDMAMQDGDILFVPGRRGKFAQQSGIQTLFALAAGAALHF